MGIPHIEADGRRVEVEAMSSATGTRHHATTAVEGTPKRRDGAAKRSRRADLEPQQTREEMSAAAATATRYALPKAARYERDGHASSY